MYKPSLGIIGFFVGVSSSFILLSLIFNNFDATWKVWLFFGISVVLGCLFAALVILIEKVAIFFAAGFLGFIVSASIYTTFISQYAGDHSNLWFA